MPIISDSEKLKGLFDKYHDPFKKLLAIIESRNENFPKPIFELIEEFNDSIAQCFQNDITDEKIESELKNAEQKITKAILVCYKSLIAFIYKDMKRFIKETKKPGLKLISEGEFYPAFMTLMGKAKLKVRNARKLELQDQLSSFIYYKEAYEAYREIDELIDEKAVAVNWTKIKAPLSLPYKIFIFIFTAIIIPVVISILFPCNFLNKVIIFCSTIFN